MLQSQLIQEVPEDVRTTDHWEEKAVNRTPEVGGVADVVHVALSHVPAVQEV